MVSDAREVYYAAMAVFCTTTGREERKEALRQVYAALDEVNVVEGWYDCKTTRAILEAWRKDAGRV